MYLQKIKLENIKCFEDLELDFVQGRDTPRLMTVVLGDNGTGKTTLLQAIALALVGEDLIQTPFFFSRNSGVWMRIDSKSGKAQATVSFKPNGQSTKRAKKTAGTEFIVDMGGYYREWIDSERKWIKKGKLKNELICGYGPLRRFRTRSETNESDLTAFGSLFGRDEWLISIEDWLVELDRRALIEESEGKDSKYREEFNQLAWTLLKILPKEDVKLSNEVADIRITAPSNYVKTTAEEGVVWRDQFGHWVKLSQLSDGYQSAMSWAGDLVSRLSRAYPNVENLLEQEGIVLIDEIDVHLHPTWQRKILRQLRQTFPNIQFIVTTHSPLVAASAHEGELFVLKKEQDHVVLEPGTSVQGWRADQILTSPLFGLETTRAPETEQQLARYDTLLTQKARGTLSATAAQELANLEETLRETLPPPGETPEQRELQQQMEDYIKQTLTQK